MSEHNRQKNNVSGNYVLTGGNSGIGRAVAAMLVAEGCQVLLCGRRTARNEAAAREMNQAGPGKAVAMTADVSIEADCRKLIQRAVEEFGRLDGLVNNAGVGGRAAIVDIDTAELERVLKINLYGAVWCAREAFRAMRDNEPGANGLRGVILNVASVLGLDAWAGTGPYAMSKHAMVGLTRALADEGSEPRIRAAAICPALVATELTGASGEEVIQPEDIAETVRWLLRLGPAAWPVEVAVPRRGAE